MEDDDREVKDSNKHIEITDKNIITGEEYNLLKISHMPITNIDIYQNHKKSNNIDNNNNDNNNND